MNFRQKNIKRINQAMILIVLFLPIIGILAIRHTPQKGFTDLIMFGKRFEENRLEEINQVAPYTHREWGSDGQFYVQLALDPFLNRVDELEAAIDNLKYRATRIGLPLLAFILGFGNPIRIIHVYSLVNIFFWIVLLALLWHYIGFHNWKGFLLAISLLWSVGSIISISRALTDLPAFVIILAAIWIDSKWVFSALVMSYSLLIKETSILSMLGLVFPTEMGVKKMISSFFIIIAPITIWLLYLNLKLGESPAVGSVFDFPLKGFLFKLTDSLTEFAASLSSPSPWPSYKLFRLFDIVTPISLLIQSLYFFKKLRFKSIEWRTGIGFAFLFFLLGDKVWADLYAYTRVLIPLTFSFNLLIYKYEKNGLYTIWFLLGNLGMLWGVIDILYSVFG